MTSKTIILSKPDQNSSRAILTLYLEDDLLKCKLRPYNLPNLSPSVKLGLYHNEEVFSANLLEKNGMYTSSFVGNFDMEQDFYCALVDTQGENRVIISGGTYSGYFLNDDTVFLNVNQKKPDPQPSEIKQDPSCDNDCSRCVYKDYFFNTNVSDQQTFAPSNVGQKIKQKEEKKTESIIAVPSLSNEILTHFEQIFATYPIDPALSDLIEGGKFVKMNEGDNEYYIGTISENNVLKYICYAKRANYNDPVPEELGNHYKWVPINSIDPLSDGYYVVFQDADDLKIVEFN